MTEWIRQLFEESDLLRMGHSQRADDLNLGLGWLYYAMGRIVRPRNAVVIGSYRGFVPIVIARALQDNLEPGEVTFIDPSMADTFWDDPVTVAKYFVDHGVANVRHFRMTTQQFVLTEAYRALGEIGMLFIGNITEEFQARDRPTPPPEATRVSGLRAAPRWLAWWCATTRCMARTRPTRCASSISSISSSRMRACR